MGNVWVSLRITKKTAHSIVSEPIKRFLRREDTEGRISRVLLPIPVPATVTPWSQERDFPSKTSNSYNSIPRGFTAQDVSSRKDLEVRVGISSTRREKDSWNDMHLPQKISRVVTSSPEV